MGKRGPAPKGEYVGQTAVLSTRISPELRQRLEGEVAESGKTLSREIEHRLRRSFIEDDKISDAFGNRRNYALMRAMAMVIELWHNPSKLDADWTKDPTAYDLVCRKIAAFLEAMRPPGEADELSELEQVLADSSVRGHPTGLIDAIQRADEALPLRGGRQRQVLSNIRSDLGEMIDRPKITLGRSEDLRREADRISPPSHKPRRKK